METLVQGLIDKIKQLEAREVQDRQANDAMQRELQRLQKKVTSLESTDSKEKSTSLVYV